MSRLGLTPEQARLLAYIAEFSEREGHSPSYEQMKRAMGLASKSGINRLVVALEERGAIVRLPNHSRAISVVDRASKFSSAAEIHIKAYCQRNRASREEAVAVAVESYFAGQA